MIDKTLRIIDANINRAMEGLRVVEDTVRFLLNNKELTKKLKHHRSKLKKALDFLPIYQEKLIWARKARYDIGRELYPQTEAKRGNITQIVTSNFKRTEESLRVLEEYVKVLNPKFGKTFKNLRFELYDLEKEILIEIIKFDKKLQKERKLNFDLYAISDRSILKGRTHIDLIKEFIASGIKIIQLRDKEVNRREYYRIAKKVRGLTERVGITFIVNDYVDIAKAVDADGVHLGQDDVPVSCAREILGDEKIIGVSTHNLFQALKAEKEGADYISVGPIFPTPFKSKLKPLGLKILKNIIKKVQIPVVAIGGINEDNIYNVYKTGVRRFALIRAFSMKKNIKMVVNSLRRKIKS